MTVWRASFAATVMLFLSGGCVDAMGEDLPPIDWKGIERAAQRVTEGEPYILSLPARRRECTETSRPYGSSMSVDAMFASLSIWRTCFRVMILKLTEIYGQADGPSTAEMAKSLDWIGKAMEDLRIRQAGGGIGGCDMDELCGGTDWMMSGYADHLRFYADIVAALAVYNATSSELPGFDTDSWMPAWEEAGKY